MVGYFFTLKQFFMVVAALIAVFVVLIVMIVRIGRKSK